MGAAMPNRNTAQVSSTRRPLATKLFLFRPTRAPAHATTGSPHTPAQAPAPAPRRHASRKVAAWVTPCLSAALALPALAVESSGFGDDAMASLQEQTRSATAAPAYEVNTLVLPNLGDTSFGSNNPSQRPGSASGFANATQHIDVTRWLTPDAPRSVGFSLGLTSAAPSAHSLANAGNSLNGAPAAPSSLDLGVRWRSRLASGRHLDVSAWAQTPQLAQSPDAMGLIWQQQQPVYGTRVEMQWASSRTRGLVPEFGAIGVQLQGGSRLVLRARKGGPMLYYRAKF